MSGQPPLRVQHSAVVPAAADAVYALLAQPRRRPEWLPELRSVDAPAGPVATGDDFTGVSHAFLHDVVGRSRVVVAEPPLRLEEVVVVGVRISSSWTLVSTGAGTEVTGTMDVEVPAGPLAPLERLVLRWWVGRLQQRSLRRLRTLMASA